MGKRQRRALDGEIEKRTCKRIKKNRDRCKNAPMKGQQICHKHGGKAPQNLRKAAERISAAAPGAAARMEHLSKYAEKEEVKLRANQDILDRTGIGKRDSLDVNINVPKWEGLLGDVFVDYSDSDIIDGEIVDEYAGVTYPERKTPVGTRPTPFPDGVPRGDAPPRYTDPAS